MAFTLPPWSTLKIVGNTYPAKASILMPFLGYLIIFQEDIAQAISSPAFFLTANQIPALKEGTGANLFFFYFGLVSFGVGSLLFAIFCDNRIKRHDDADAYADSVMTTTTYIDIKKLASYAIDKLSPADERSKPIKLIQQTLTSGTQTNITAENRNLILKTIFDLKDYNLPTIRGAALFFFGFGLMLLSIQSFIVFKAVFIEFITRVLHTI